MKKILIGFLLLIALLLALVFLGVIPKDLILGWIMPRETPVQEESVESSSSADAPLSDAPSTNLPDVPSDVNTSTGDNAGIGEAICEHVWDRVVIPSTCTTSGEEILTCSLCHESYRSEIAISYHTYDENAEFLTDNAYHWQECPFCGDIAYRDTHWFDDHGVCIDCGFNRD